MFCIKYIRLLYLYDIVDFVGKSEENRRSREASRRIGDVADAFFTESYCAQRTSMIEFCLEITFSERNRSKTYSSTRRFVFQLKSTSDCHNQDKTLNEHTLRVLQDDLSSFKFQLSEAKRRECSVSRRFSCLASKRT